MKKWEYLCAYYSKEINEDILAELGDKGWELVSVFKFNTGYHKWIFKREKVEAITPVEVD